jgi:hypothetical protein
MTEGQTGGQQRRECDRPAAEPAERASEIRMVGPLAGEDADDDALGGDPVCWAHLVCDECGAITTDGHRAGCSRQEP